MTEASIQQPEKGRLRWHCRRGMKELDVLLERFLEREYDAAGLDEQAAFADLLALPDPQLLDYLTGRATPPEPARAIVARLRAASR